MKKIACKDLVILKTLKIAIITAAVCVLTLSCPNAQQDVEIIELSNHGGSNINEAYALSEGKWTYGYLNGSNSSRWYSIPVEKDIQFNIRLYGRRDNSIMTGATFNLYKESKVIYREGPFIGSGWLFTPPASEIWFIKVELGLYENPGAFGILYTTDGELSSKPNYWE